MRQKPEIGQVFLVALDDGRFAIGQVIGIEPQSLNSITCVFSSQTTQVAEAKIESGISERDAIAALFITPDLLKTGKWKVCGKESVVIPRSKFPNEQFRTSGWIGAKIIGSGIVADFLNAYHGLRLWDDWHDPQYLDGFLLSGVSRPAKIKLKAEQHLEGDVANRAAPQD